MKYYAPETLDEVTALLHELESERVTILAGGTDVIAKRNCLPEESGWIRDNGNEVIPLEEHMIFLGNLNLDYILQEEKGIRIGTCTTLSNLVYNPIIEDKVSVLRDAITEIAGITIRNVATLGGNVMNASPAADSIPALMVLDVKLVLTGTNGDRTVEISDFFKGPGKTTCRKNEFLKELIIPVCNGKTKFLKFGRRKAETLSVVNGAARVVINDGRCVEARLAVGAVAPTPLRLITAEEMLIGKVVSEELLEKVSNSVVKMIAPVSDKRSTAAYRETLTKVLVRRMLQEVCQQ